MVKKEIRIEYEFGSPFQEKLAMELLSAIIKTYKQEFEKQHKNNKLNYEIIQCKTSSKR